MKLFIHHGYDGVESGPAKLVGALGKKKLLRLEFIPFTYATQAYDDVVVATNRGGVANRVQRAGRRSSSLPALEGSFDTSPAPRARTPARRGLVRGWTA